MPAVWFFLIALGFSHWSGAVASELGNEESVEYRRAKFNYQMFCLGCHAPDGAGHKSVPSLRDSMSQFMRFKEGRAFMVQVPGSANSVLSDEHLAEVLNWMTREFSKHVVDQDWREYTADEVSEYRKEPLLQIEKLREQLVKRFPSKKLSGKNL